MKLLWKTLLAVVGGVTCSLTTWGQNASAATGYNGNPQGLLRDSVPLTWVYNSDHVSTLPSDDKWWLTFNDSTLVALINKGEANSYNLQMARRRIEMARQSWEAASAAYYPVVTANAGWTKGQQSGATGEKVFTPVGSDFFSLGLNFSWEIDLFGRVAAQSKVAKTSYNATKSEYSSAMISLSSNIAIAYFNYRLAQCRLEVARVQLESQRKITKIAEARYEAGLASKLDVSQSLTVLYATEASLPALRSMLTSALNNIALLVGCYPTDIAGMLAEVRDLPIAFQTVNLGVPADFLRRRPDVLQAELELAGYAAQLGVAKKDFLPTLSLTGSVGTSAHRIDNLFSKNSVTYSVAPQLSWTIFEGFARNKRVAVAREQMLAGIDNYNMTVMNAVIETENALSAYDASLHQISLYRKVARESKEAFDLALERYKKGLSAYVDVMNAQINMLDYENTLLQTRASALTTLVKVYAAVAGNPFN